MRHASLGGWVAKMAAWSTVFPNGDGQVFMPGQAPRLPRWFVKLQGPYKTKPGSENFRKQSQKVLASPNGRQFRPDLEQVAGANHFALALNYGRVLPV